MLNYAIVDIKGRQYLITRKSTLEVDFLGDDVKDLVCDKILLKNEDGKLEIGEPYLKDKITFEVLSSKKERKIRVFKYHSKSNTRKTRGSRRILSVIKVK